MYQRFALTTAISSVDKGDTTEAVVCAQVHLPPGMSIKMTYNKELNKRCLDVMNCGEKITVKPRDIGLDGAESLVKRQ